MEDKDNIKHLIGDSNSRQGDVKGTKENNVKKSEINTEITTDREDDLPDLVDVSKIPPIKDLIDPEEDKAKVKKLKEEQEKKNKLDGYDVFSYNKKGNIIDVNCPQLSKLLVENDNHKYIVASDNLDIYWFNGAYYETKGENKLGERINFYLNDFFTDYRRKEVISFVKNYEPIKIDRHVLNKPPNHLIPLKNGVYDRKQKKLLGHSEDFIFLYQLPVNFNPDAKPEKFLNFLNNACNTDDIPSLQEFFGDCLQPTYKYKKAVMLVGPTNTGKSQMLSLLGVFLGENNISNVSLHDLCHDRFAKSGLYGKLANICADLGDQGIKSSRTFLLITGDDILRMQEKHKAHFNGRSYAKLIFSCNKIPQSENQTSAYYERWLIIEFSFQIEKEERIPRFYETLATEEELSGILNWALEGLERLEQNKTYTQIFTTEHVKEFMESHLEPIPLFVKEHISKDKDGIILKSDLYKKYIEYCNYKNYPKKSDNHFSRIIKKYLPDGWGDTKKGNNRAWQGIKCTWEIPKPEDEEDASNDKETDGDDDEEDIIEISV